MLVLSNATISRANTGPIQVNGYINIGEGYEGEEFSVTTNIYNDSAAYHNVTIEIQDNDINLCVDKTQLRIPGNQGITIKITGKYPKADNTSIFANLKIVDDLNYTNDQEIHFYASKVLKKDKDDNDEPSNPEDNNNHNPHKFSPVKNVKIRYDNSKQAYIFTWDPVDYATSYYLQFLKPSSHSKVVAFNITHTKTVYTNRAEVEMRPDVGVILRIQAVGNKYLPNNDCVAYLKRKSGRRGYDTITTTYNEFLEEYKERYSTNPRRRDTSTTSGGTRGNTNNGNTRRDSNNGSRTRTSYKGR
ncbi:hypothetical protein [Vallitalea guaymasensis]|uniref:Uncharacterized protein n=1 Tax=Vallitalea guaymasensis TaxID=1185412 RepID=A0A8J8SAL7_9FIRM|nr:hypothetical protein [Vallitalea guaymasensis]QUH27802.1 hypothetical protein HYG85_02280 [Vallitalea guaymasensis]